MRIVPVLDVMNGEVVRGVGGQRREYRPIVSRLTASSRPVDVAAALAAHFGYREFYVADLDAIEGGEPAWSMVDALHEQGFRLWVDAGVREMTRACQLADAGIDSIVVGLETIEGPRQFADIVAAFGRGIVFSLDLRDGQPLGDRTAWEERDAEDIAAETIRLGIGRLLVLDLAQVGCARGTGTCELCRRLRTHYPDVELSAGGGVRHRGDVEELRACGVQVVLAASALHDGRLTRADFPLTLPSPP